MTVLDSCYEKEYLPYIIAFIAIVGFYVDFKKITSKVEPVLSQYKGQSVTEVVGILYQKKENGENVPTLKDLKHYSFSKVVSSVCAIVFVISLVLASIFELIVGAPVGWLLNIIIIILITIYIGSIRFHKYGEYLYLTPNKGTGYFVIAIIFCVSGLGVLLTTYTVALKCDHPWYYEAVKYAVLNGIGSLFFCMGYFSLHSKKLEDMK